MKSAPTKLTSFVSLLRVTTKRPLVPIAVLSLLAWAVVPGQAANALFNGNLDQIGMTTQQNPCPLGWIVDSRLSVSAPLGGYQDGGDSEPWCNVLDPGGYGFFFKPFQGKLGILNDLLTVYLYQDNPATPGTKFTLSGYAAGEANYSGFFNTNSPNPATLFVVEFLDNNGSMIASNIYDLVAAGLPSTGAGAMMQFTTPQFIAPPNTVTVRVGASMMNVYSTSGAQSFFADAFDLEAVAPPGAPVITNQPFQVSIPLGGSATFNVGVSNTTGITYQWQHANTNLTDGAEFSGTGTATLHVTGATLADAGHYRVLVSNSSGAIYSDEVTLTILGIGMYPVVSVSGKTGDTYRIDYATSVAPSNWLPLSTNKLTSATWQFIDTSYPQDQARFYRAIFLY